MKNKQKKHKQKKDQITNRPLAKILLFPISLLAFLFRSVREKIRVSIRLKLSLRYVGILAGTMLAAAFGVICLFGAFTFQETAAGKYEPLVKILNNPRTDYQAIEKYSKDFDVPILIYNQNKNLLYATESAPVGQEYRSRDGIMRLKQNIYLTLNRNIVISGDPAKAVVYFNIAGEVNQVLRFSRTVFFVFSIILILALIPTFSAGRGIFQPIREMTRTVKEISENNLNLRLNIGGSKNELKELALTFNEMMNRIEDQYNQQRQFVSDASHELRTPIAVIQGYAVMLNRWGKNDPEVLQESIEAIKNESENMQQLIDKLLFLARHDKSSFIIQKEDFSLTEMLLEIVKETQMIDSSHRINQAVNQEVSVCGDKNRLKQAIRILIDNALKYTPEGGEITITLGKEGDLASVAIKDTGIGMTGEELRHIFDRFYRADQSRTKEKGGHGLGLAIAKIIILEHNGRINVKSKVGEGSEFRFFLPS